VKSEIHIEMKHKSEFFLFFSYISLKMADFGKFLKSDQNSSTSAMFSFEIYKLM